MFISLVTADLSYCFAIISLIIFRHSSVSLKFFRLTFVNAILLPLTKLNHIAWPIPYSTKFISLQIFMYQYTITVLKNFYVCANSLPCSKY